MPIVLQTAQPNPIFTPDSLPSCGIGVGGLPHGVQIVRRKGRLDVGTKSEIGCQGDECRTNVVSSYVAAIGDGRALLY